MTKAVYKSKCCNAEVRADGMPDFIGSKKICTISFVCLGCKKPCNVVTTKSQKRKKKQRVLTTKKRIREKEKQLDFQGKILQKLIELLDGITIHPVKGVILTSKKKHQLAELQEIERKLFKSKTKKPRK